MTPEEIRERLASLREMDFTGAEKLAKNMSTDTRDLLASFARVLETPFHQDRSKVESVLKLLGELAILPFLAASRKLDGVHRVHAVQEANRIYLELHGQAVQKLKGMLDGQTPLPPPRDMGPIEVRVPVTRECDDAYLLLRHLHKPDEAEADDRRYRLRFARMSEAERDPLIRHYRDTGEFQ